MGVFVIVFGDSGFENSLGVSVRASSFFSLNVKWKLNVYGDTCLTKIVKQRSSGEKAESEDAMLTGC